APLACVVVSAAEVTVAPVVGRPMALAGMDAPVSAEQGWAVCAAAGRANPSTVITTGILSIGFISVFPFPGAGPIPNSIAKYPYVRKSLPPYRDRWRRNFRPLF